MPGHFRVDNGYPFGSTGDWPPVLSLWLIGLGVGVTWNPPRQPWNNGVVERSQGTAKRWAEPNSCLTPGQLQSELDRADELQREGYPYRAGRSRAECWPGLGHSGRPYLAAGERRIWSLDPVREHLGGYARRRRVDQSGKVSLYDRLRYVGVAQAGREVVVQFDPERLEWIFSDLSGTQLRARPAEEMTAEQICGLWGQSE